MREYRTPLPQLLASSLEAAANRVLALDHAAAERLTRLEGKTLELELEGLDITLFLTTRYGAVHVSLDAPGAADTQIRGTPFALFAMAAPEEDAHWDRPGSPVHISGDAGLAREIERLFHSLDPDWEGQLAVLFGDVAGFQLASGLRKGAGFMRAAARQAGDATRRFLGEGSGPVTTTAEFEPFARGVDQLSKALDRLEQRLQRDGGSGE